MTFTSRAGLVAATLFLSAGLCHAQDLTTKERAFVDAIEAAVGQGEAEEVDKNVAGTGRERVVQISVEVTDDIEIHLARYATAALAFEVASSRALYSAMADNPSLTESRGRDVLVLEGPLADPGFVEKLRKEAWQAHPWSRPSSRISLLQLNLLEDGSVTRAARPEGEAYERIKRLFDRSLEAARDAQADPDPDAEEEYEIVSSTELKVKAEEMTFHFKVTDRSATQIMAPNDPDPVLVTFAELARLPIVTASTTGAAGALGRATR